MNYKDNSHPMKSYTNFIEDCAKFFNLILACYLFTLHLFYFSHFLFN